MMRNINKFLVFLVICGIAASSSFHEYGHINNTRHIDEHHDSSANTHTHFRDELSAIDIHDHHHPNLHRHLDKLFIRSLRQKELDNNFFNPQIIGTHNEFLELASFEVRNDIGHYLQTDFCNSPYIFQNQPLRI